MPPSARGDSAADVQVFGLVGLRAGRASVAPGRAVRLAGGAVDGAPVRLADAEDRARDGDDPLRRRTVGGARRGEAAPALRGDRSPSARCSTDGPEPGTHASRGPGAAWLGGPLSHHARPYVAGVLAASMRGSPGRRQLALAQVIAHDVRVERTSWPARSATRPTARRSSARRHPPRGDAARLPSRSGRRGAGSRYFRGGDEPWEVRRSTAEVRAALGDVQRLGGDGRSWRSRVPTASSASPANGSARRSGSRAVPRRSWRGGDGAHPRTWTRSRPRARRRGGPALGADARTSSCGGRTVSAHDQSRSVLLHRPRARRAGPALDAAGRPRAVRREPPLREIRRGLPRISRTMLSARLHELVDTGIARRGQDADGPFYELTPEGRELEGTLRELGVWGQRWLSRELTADLLDTDTLVSDMRRHIDRDAPPPLAPASPGSRPGSSRAGERSASSCCGGARCPCARPSAGFPVELDVRAPLRTLTAWWRGDVTLTEARASGLVDRRTARVGPGLPALVRALPLRGNSTCPPGVSRRAGPHSVPPRPAGGR